MGLFFVLVLSSPELAGRKILNGSFNANYRNQEDFNQGSINTRILIGKIREDNTYLALGGSFNYSATNQRDSGVGSIDPAFESGKVCEVGR